jgi:hypothetical protein
MARTNFGYACKTCLKSPRIAQGERKHKKRIKTLPDLKKELTEHFNKYIRLRDTDSNGVGRCISCGAVINLGGFDAGHFLPTTYSATRFDEQNVHGQCKQCNYYKHGNLTMYGEGLVRKIGAQAVDELKMRKNNVVKLQRIHLELLIAEYRQKASELEKTKIKQ